MEAMFLECICNLAYKEGNCWARNSFFAKEFNISNRYVTEVLASLEKFGYIKRVTENGSKRKIFVNYRKLKIDQQETTKNPRTSETGEIGIT